MNRETIDRMTSLLGLTLPAVLIVGGSLLTWGPLVLSAFGLRHSRHDPDVDVCPRGPAVVTPIPVRAR